MFKLMMLSALLRVNDMPALAGGCIYAGQSEEVGLARGGVPTRADNV